jgi:hypothetical protein
MINLPGSENMIAEFNKWEETNETLPIRRIPILLIAMIRP